MFTQTWALGRSSAFAAVRLRYLHQWHHLWCQHRSHRDASYQKGPQNKGTSGFVFKLCGGAVAWGSKLQSVTALSTTEAEVIAAGAAARVAIFLYRLLSDLQLPVGPARDPTSTTMLVLADNQAALCLL